MISGTKKTEEIRAVVEEGIQDFLREVAVHRENGRVGEADRLDKFCEYTAEYIRLLENTIRGHAATIKALSECLDGIRK